MPDTLDREKGNTRISLYPLTFEEAVQVIVQDNPKQKDSPAEGFAS